MVTADWDDVRERATVDEGMPEAEPTPEPVPSPEVVHLPEPVQLPQPVPVPEPLVESFSLPEPEPELHGGGAGWCAQCGALLAASDIFCGECGFVRSSPRERDTGVLDPFPWGAPLEPEVPSTVHLSTALPVEPEPDPDDDLDDTRIVAPGARGDRFILQFSTGESISVTGAGLLGRNPMPEPGEYFDALVAISDPGKSVSKTHLEFGQDGGSFWISDRFSGNGTVIREPDRQARRCDPGKRYRIVRGTRVDIGEQFFVVS